MKNKTPKSRLLTLYPKQYEFFSHPAREKYVCCGRRFGKSRLLLTAIVEKAMNYEGEYDAMSPPTVLLACPTLKQARRIHWQSLCNLLDGDPRVEKIYRSEFMIRLKGDKPDIILAGTNPDNGDSLRGLKLFFAALDEVQDINPEVIREVIRPALADTKNSTLWAIGTPKGIGSSFYEDCMLAQKEMQAGNPRYGYFFGRTLDNPFISEEEIEEARKRLPARIFNQEFNADWVSFEGAIFSNFNIEKHVQPLVEFPEKYDAIYMGVDWGAVNPAIVVLGKKNNIYYIIDYFLNMPMVGNRKAPVEEHIFMEKAKELATKYKVKQAFADPSQPGQIITFRKAGVTKLLKGYNRVDEGNGVVNTMFWQDRIIVAQEFKPVIQQLQSYHRAVDENEQILDEVEEGQDDHACFTEDMEVLTSRYGWLPIEHIQTNMRIVTHKANYTTYAAGCFRSAPIWHIELSNGDTLRCTQHHKFPTVKLDKDNVVLQKDKIPAYLLEGKLLYTLDSNYVEVIKVYKTNNVERVFNLSVRSEHKYFVRPRGSNNSGIYTYNCDALRYILATLERKNIAKEMGRSVDYFDDLLEERKQENIYGDFYDLLP